MQCNSVICFTNKWFSWASYFNDLLKKIGYKFESDYAFTNPNYSEQLVN